MNDAEAGTRTEQDRKSPTDRPSRIDWVIRAGRRVRLTLTAFVIVNVCALVLDSHLAREVGSRLTPMLDAIHHVSHNVVTSHLWLEEHLANHDLFGMDDVTWHISQAEAVVREVLEGHQIHMLPFNGAPEGELGTHWSLLLEKVLRLQKITADVIASAKRGKLERPPEYDNAVRDVVSFAHHLEASLEDRITQNIAWLGKLHVAGVMGFLLLVGFGAWFINRNFHQLSHEIHRRSAAEANLKENRDKLKAALATKDQLLSKVSHEVRTPVNAILGLATVMEGTQLTGAQRKYLRMLESETHALGRIMDDLLDFSKIEYAKVRVNSHEIDLRRIFADATDRKIAEAEAKGIRLDIDLPLDFPTCLLGDGGRLRQVLLNLINNAIKFTDQGTILVGLSGRPMHDGRYEVNFWVSDTGVGVPAEKHEHIFEPFAQADDSTTRRFGGTGLGLAICRELVGLMGGSIGLEDVPQGGSRFWVQVPLQQVEDDNQTGSPDRLVDYPLLLVDLDDDLRDRTGRMLQDLGATVRAVDDPAEAATMLRAATDDDVPFRAVLASERLSQDAVGQLVSGIRADQRLAAMPVFVLVGSTTRLHQLRDVASGVSGYVSSPHRALDLPPMLLDGHSHQQADASPAAQEPAFPARFAGLEVLLVDDHPVAQIAGRYMLERLGCHVDSAENGAEALRLWRAKQYDAVFLDWHMPDIDGLEVAARIREIERNQHRPRSFLVAMTANALASDRQRCLAAGMDEYISKPVTSEALSRALNCIGEQRNSA